jgi:hypothetical protein
MRGFSVRWRGASWLNEPLPAASNREAPGVRAASSPADEYIVDPALRARNLAIAEPKGRPHPIIAARFRASQCSKKCSKARRDRFLSGKYLIPNHAGVAKWQTRQT